MNSRMMRAAICVAVVCLSLIGVSMEEGERREYKWEVRHEYKSPDCYRKLALTINGSSPGPTIEARQGDTVVVSIKNHLITENLAIHWHGIRQIGTPWMDGTEGITQCAVGPGETFTYEFVVDRPGTYAYHAHYGMQRKAGLFGLIKVDLPKGQKEPFTYEEDRGLVLSDWWHRNTYEQSIGLSSNPFVWVGDPQSLLIHGKGKYDCNQVKCTPSDTTNSCNSSNPDCAPFIVDVDPGKTYRLRIASLTSLNALSFEIEGHNMTVVEADGHYVDPFNVTNLFLYSGETYSVLITTNQDPTKNYWITSNIVARIPNTPTGLAILNYKPKDKPIISPTTKPTTGPTWDDPTPRIQQSHAIKAHKTHDVNPPPKKSDRTIIILNTQNKYNGFIRWSLNNVSLILPETPYLISMKYNLTDVFSSSPPAETYDYKTYDINSPPQNPNTTLGNSVYNLKLNSTVDVILQNANTLNPNNSETHPWHLHGHDFWVLGYGGGIFDPETDVKKFNLDDPIMKNTVPLHPYGWTALRFKADNPGVWLFHCHVESHSYMGMGLVFAEGVDKVGKLPYSIMGCGETKQFIKTT